MNTRVKEPTENRAGFQVLNHLNWVPGTNLGTTSAVCVLHCWLISSALKICIMWNIIQRYCSTVHLYFNISPFSFDYFRNFGHFPTFMNIGFYRESRKILRVSEWKMVYVCNHRRQFEISRSSLVPQWVQGQLGLHGIQSQSKKFKIKKQRHWTVEQPQLLSTQCFCRELGFDCQALTVWLTAIQNSSSRWTDALLWPPLAPEKHVMHRLTHEQNTCESSRWLHSLFFKREMWTRWRLIRSRDILRLHFKCCENYPPSNFLLLLEHK